MKKFEQELTEETENRNDADCEYFDTPVGIAFRRVLNHRIEQAGRPRLLWDLRWDAVERDPYRALFLGGPPTNNHAERALRPLVIFRKVCMGTRSRVDSDNISVFSSLTQTEKLQNAAVLDLLGALLVGTPAHAQELIFNDSS